MMNGVQQGRALKLRPGVNRIGRGTENHFQVPDPSISSSHCEVILLGAGVFVRDLNSTNGTCIDNVPVQESVMRSGQVLQAGNIDLQLEELPDEDGRVEIRVPDLFSGGVGAPLVLPDGNAACVTHPGIRAEYRCTQCQQTLCESCVRVIRRVSGDSLAFCSLCSAQALPLDAAPPSPQPAPERRRGLFSRLGRTLKLTRKQMERSPRQTDREGKTPGAEE